jgi:hypothetical protein
MLLNEVQWQAEQNQCDRLGPLRNPCADRRG